VDSENMVNMVALTGILAEIRPPSQCSAVTTTAGSNLFGTSLNWTEGRSLAGTCDVSNTVDRFSASLCPAMTTTLTA